MSVDLLPCLNNCPQVRRDVMPLVVVEFLMRVADIFVDYFGELNEHAIKDNFITVYELLDEMLDNGLPLNMELSVLKELVKPPDPFAKMIGTVTGDWRSNTELPQSTLTNVPWRRTGIRYLQHEIFVDIVEEIDALVSKSGRPVHMQVTGSIFCNAKLSGMPDVQMVLNRSRYDIVDTALHPCVRLKRYEEEGVLSFVPPDSAFKLATYVLRKEYPIPISVRPKIKYDELSHAGELSVAVTPQYSRGPGADGSIEDCIVTIQFTEEVSSTSLSSNIGSTHFDSARKVCTWTVGQVPFGRTAMMTGGLALDPTMPTPKRQPSVLLQFKILSNSVSGLMIEGCTVLGESKQPYRGLRCITKARKLEYAT
mmetsp:Transcript_15521/g.63296  ORF Transcript_15521/g.63296 Transcript_15521/m.63296 type:complete len:367 (-) Transcript_15521:235-1335(-)